MNNTNPNGTDWYDGDHHDTADDYCEHEQKWEDDCALCGRGLNVMLPECPTFEMLEYWQAHSELFAEIDAR